MGCSVGFYYIAIERLRQRIKSFPINEIPYYHIISPNQKVHRESIVFYHFNRVEKNVNGIISEFMTGKLYNVHII